MRFLDFVIFCYFFFFGLYNHRETHYNIRYYTLFFNSSFFTLVSISAHCKMNLLSAPIYGSIVIRIIFALKGAPSYAHI